MKIFNFFFICIILLNGCYINKGLTKDQIEKIINENLKYGDPETEIINFLDTQKWGYSYDTSLKRYQVRCPISEKKRYILSTREIFIDIYVDSEKSNSFKYADVIYLYTSF